MKPLTYLFPAICLLLLCGSLFAQTRPASRPAALSPEDRQKAAGLYQQMARQFQAKEYDAAATSSRELLELLPDNADIYYNLACALARLAKADEALGSLKAAIDHGYDQPAHMRADEDLAGLRGDKRFGDLAAAAAANLRKNVESKRDKGAPIDGVKMIEGMPEEGLPWRLRISPDATKEKPQKLIVWLHPSGGSMNNAAEKMSSMLNRGGYALLVLTYKNFGGWSGEDAEKILNKTLPDVAKVEGVDVRRPLLFGYSAGGQMALVLWQQNPDKFGGLILDAAYPVEMTPQGFKAMAMPNDPAIKSTPIFVVVGTKDGGSAIWRKRQGEFAAAGVPLVIHYVQDKPHTWLFDAERIDLLNKWLADVLAGKLPAMPTTAAMPATQP